MKDLLSLGPIALQQAVYYGRTVHLAGHLVDVKVQGKQLYGVLEVTGTKDEELMRILSGRRPRLVQVHFCDPQCTQLVTDETLVHSRTFEAVDLRRLPWLTCLEEARPPAEENDELEKLRQEQERMARTELREAEEKGGNGKKKKKGDDLGLLKKPEARRSWVRKTWKRSLGVPG